MRPILTALCTCMALLLLGCKPAPSPETGAAAEDTGPVIKGMVLSAEPVTLGDTAELHVRLLDTTRADAEPTLVAEQTLPVRGLPSPFEMRYDPAAVNPIRSYAVDASVLDQGQVRYVSTSRVPALRGKAKLLRIQLVQALSTVTQDPAAAMVSAYAEFEARLGGLKRFADSRIIGPEGSETAIGWDAFADESGLRMVRETVSDAEGNNRYIRKFAYLNGKPWVASRERGGTVVRLGWDEDGKLVLRQRNGQDDPSVEAEAGELLRQAREAFNIASARVPG